jgi:GxxExxY protein
MKSQMIYPDESYAIRGAVFEVYRELGNGFQEEVYQQCLERELFMRGIPFSPKKELRIHYKGEPIAKTYIPDFFCYDRIIVEIKAVSALQKEHRAQLLNYLRLTRCRLGMLVNFGAYPKVAIEQWANGETASVS